MTPEFDGGLSAPIVEESHSDLKTATFTTDDTEDTPIPVEQPETVGGLVAPERSVTPSQKQILPSVLDEIPATTQAQVLSPITSTPQLDVFEQVHQSAGPPAPPPAGLGGGTHAIDGESGAVASSPQFAFQTLSYMGENQPPIAYDDSYSASGTMTLVDNVTNNDVDPEFDPLTATVVSGPSNGSFSYFNTDGSFEYIPNPGWAGTDTFSYKLNDGFQAISPLSPSK